ncbi:N-acetylmuramoyl-L-alanine amidase [uncultured Desulfosarcina sp.]|uniref:N-acetylmuramoyl-L-alanine amidase family protein n=1 Tax=uncultured Desulfosarcina sp. TaxID=218289 RepID=UPI0029C8D77C|nr:N-acetylmuramoyl-L-alanine amidase [uncultured Desulfosarcina sp.]
MIDPSVKDFTLPMAAIEPLPNFRPRVLVTLIGFLCLIGLLFMPAGHSQAAVIVLDPGHGGNDSGTGRSSEFPEKQFTLALAQKIASQLAARHQVELTRTADIQMAPADRAAVANHLRADLMISLHTAVAPFCTDRSVAVYYHYDERLSLPSGNSIQGNPAELDANRPVWAKLQDRHQHRSQYLAATLKQALENSATFDSVTVSGVPLVTLMGADLPAVLVEVGCIHPVGASNPQTLKQQLNGYADSIANAIEMALPGLLQ